MPKFETKVKKSRVELKGLVKRYVCQGLTQVEIAKLLGMSRQAVHYWVELLRKEEEGK